MELTITTTYWIEIDEIVKMIHKYNMTIEEAVDEYIESLDDDIYDSIGEIEIKQIISKVKNQL